MSEDATTITMYSDYVCPFCYLGRRSLEGYRERRTGPVAVDWRPFDLRSRKRGPDGEIDHSVADGKDDAYFEQVRENVARLKKRYDAAEMLAIDELPEPVDSLPAQVLSAHVQSEHPDRWAALDEAIFEALWVEGRDIGDPAVLVELAGEVGLDGEAVRSVLDDESRREELLAQCRDAVDGGITGVPTFEYEGYTARGAVPPEQLERLVEGT